MTVEKEPSAAERAARLKERIYLTFAALGVVIALDVHVNVTAWEAVATLILTVLGTLSAVFTADLLSLIIAHSRLPSRSELQHAIRSSFGALSALAIPMIFLVLALVGRWTIHTALRASMIALIVALVAIGYLAVRRIRVNLWQRLIILGAEGLLGLVVVGLQILAHG